MGSLHIKETALTPVIIFYPVTRELKMEGKMIPENALDTFDPIYKFIENYFEDDDSLYLLFRLYHYNSSAARQFFLLCRKLDEYFANGKTISVRWEYEDGDDESKSDALVFLKDSKFPYKLVEVTA